MKKILIHTIVFSPDRVSTAYIYNDIALKFRDNGYNVSVLTTTPHYNPDITEDNQQKLVRKFFGLFYESDFHGIKVRHIPLKKFKSIPLRILGFLYWHFMGLVLGLFEKKLDLILSPSPPLSIGLVNIILGKIKNSRVIYNVQEIYPDLLIQDRNLKSKLVIGALKQMEKYVYNGSDCVVTIDEIFYNIIQKRFNDSTKLFIIPNFVDTSLYKPVDLNKLNTDSFFAENNSLKIMYAGNIGLSQDWVTLIQIATNLKNENVEFFIIGEGAMKGYLESEIESNGLNKVHLYSYQPREIMPSLLAYADLHFIFMAPHTEMLGFPSKVYTIMACAKPILVSSGSGTSIINFLRKQDCAFLVDDSDQDIKINKLVEIIKTVTPDQLVLKGNNGYKSIQNSYTKDIVTDMYVELLKTL